MIHGVSVKGAGKDAGRAGTAARGRLFKATTTNLTRAENPEDPPSDGFSRKHLEENPHTDIQIWD